MQRLILSFLLFTLTSFNALASDNRVSAVTDFLIQRAEDNALYMFELRLKRNDEFACHFPDTYKYVENGELRFLMKSSKRWDEAISADLKTMAVRYAASEINEALNFKELAMDFTNEFIETSQYLELSYEGKQYPLNVMPLTQDQQLRDLINGFYDQPVTLRDQLSTMGEAFTKLDAKCDTLALNEQQFIQLSDDLKQALEGLKPWAEFVAKNAKKLTINKPLLEEKCGSEPDYLPCRYLKKSPEELLSSPTAKVLAASVVTAAAVVTLKQYGSKLEKAESAVEKVQIGDDFLSKSRAKKLIKNPEKLKKQVMFFAEIADAKSKEEVQEILTNYTLPPVTFGIKREPGRHNLLISGYLTYSGGKTLNEDDFGKSNSHGVYAPVGLEYSYGLKNGSLALMISPMDFGYPISLKLNGIDSNVDLDEVIAPSIAFSYGWKDYPLSIGLSYQQGRKALTSNDTEKRVMLFFGIDMPLLSLF